MMMTMKDRRGYYCVERRKKTKNEKKKYSHCWESRVLLLPLYLHDRHHQRLLLRAKVRRLHSHSIHCNFLDVDVEFRFHLKHATSSAVSQDRLRKRTRISQIECWCLRFGYPGICATRSHPTQRE